MGSVAESGNLEAEGQGFSLNSGSASAVWLGDVFVLTSGHLIRHWPVQGGFLAPQLAAVVDTETSEPSAISTSSVWFPLQFLAGEYDYRHADTGDWALLSAENATPAGTQANELSGLRKKLPDPDDTLQLEGHPGGQWQLDRQEVFIVDDPAPTRQFFWTTGNAVSGSSGSGLTDRAGQLLGILSGTNRDSQGLERVRFQRLGPVVAALREII